MELSSKELRILDGDDGWVRQQAIEHQIAVGDFFGAADLVPVSQAHIMADSEALGNSGVDYLEKLAAQPADERSVIIPTLTDPRGCDFSCIERLRQEKKVVSLESRIIDAFRSMGIMLTNTCINYQTFMAPVFGEHLAFGDTGVVIYSNSVLGARTNYEGGPSALAAGLTGRTPRYGFHLDANRRGSMRFMIDFTPNDWSEWGALGGTIGKHMRSYWDVPVLEGDFGHPTSDDLKHFGAALASYGSTALFHLVGITPEAPDLQACFDGDSPEPHTVTLDDVSTLFRDNAPSDNAIDVVVFAAPQLSLVEIEKLASLLRGRALRDETALIMATNPENKNAADRMGFTQLIESAGGLVLEGVCFYQMHARELGEVNDWSRLMTNSAKLVNIIKGYGYEPILGSMEACVEAACRDL